MDSQFFKPPPIGTMMPHSRSPPNYTPHPHPPPPTPDGRVPALKTQGRGQ